MHRSSAQRLARSAKDPSWTPIVACPYAPRCMRSSALLSLVLLGCGATNSAPTDGAVAVPAPPSATASASAIASPSLPPGVEARLGCTDITTEQVDRELAAQQRLSQEPLTREVVRDRLIQAVVIGDYARKEQLSVASSEVDLALERIAKENKLTVEQMLSEVRKTGVDETYYRSSMRDQMLAMRVRMRLVPGESDTPALLKKSDLELERLRAALASRRVYRTEKGCSETPLE
jgi:parvulin-like peptidyl-prolyl isomerase